MTRAIFLCHTAAPSGAELATLRLLTALRADGAVDASLLLTEDGPLTELARARDIPVTVCGNDFDSRSLTIAAAGPLRLLTGASALMRLGWRLGGLVRDGQADVLVAQSTKALLMGAVAARRAGVPLVWQVHDRISTEYFGPILAPSLRILGLLVARGVIANSRATLATLHTRGRVGAVAYPGLEARPALAREPQRAPERVRVVMVGRLTPWKGQSVLLRALSRLPHRPQAVSIVGGAFFGEQDYARALEHEAAALGVEVEFTGHLDDPAPRLAQADIAVHCSVTAEPFGQVVVEAMRAGCAVIASAAGGPLEIVRPGVDGVLVAPGDPDALARALAALIADPRRRAELAEAAVERADEFGIEATARSVGAVLSAVTGSRTVARA